MGIERSRRWVIVGLVGVLLTGGCTNDDGGDDAGGRTDAEATATTAVAPPTTDAAPEYDFSDVDAAVDEFVREATMNGAGLVIVHREHGRIHEHYSGEFDADRISLIASSSKMLTAGILMALHDEGLLDVDAPVAEVVEWGAAHPEVTPAQLLSNSSGLVGLIDEPAFAPYICQYLPTGDLRSCGERIFTTPEDDEKVIPPDTRFRYGGGQWQVAGAVAEAASGRSWAQLVERTYNEPCGLRSLAYNNHFTQLVSDQGPFSYPAQFNADPTTLQPTENPNMEGGAYITPREYGELLLMHLRGGMCGDRRVLSEDSVRRMHSDRIGPAYGGTARPGMEGYGLGWWVDRDEPDHIEDGGAFGSVPWLDLGRGYGAYLVVERSAKDGRDLAERIRPLVDAGIDRAAE